MTLYQMHIKELLPEMLIKLNSEKAAVLLDEFLIH